MNPCRAITFAALSVLASPELRGQEVRRSGTFEFGVTLGRPIRSVVKAEIPLTVFRGFVVSGQGAGAYGLRVGTAVNRKLIFSGQINVLDGQSETRSIGGGYIAETNIVNVVYEAAFQLLLPKWRTRVFEPYLHAGAATVQSRADVLLRFTNPDPNPPPNAVLGGATRTRMSRASFALSTGAGIRLRANRRFGFLLEGKFLFPFGATRSPASILAAGAYVEFR